ncbi:spore germination protein GerPC [Cohnella nanjingensis]|uniref:Uncharacterized protein n=1 Tax=Cohnella nanjingensis TaxID=1387779 RepID=A0A7X0VGS3_9BACL|nr:spore germination protein GerPC [Cohnella nanjingensis]MBB6673402.1 hypothetical protein [Cohnella nanjingensis]
MTTNSTWPWPQGPTDWKDIVWQLQLTEQRLQTALAQIDAMQRQLDDLQKKPPIHVEYHFDQLKVSRLDGTLNIGLTPQGQQGDVDSFETPVPGMWNPPAQPQDEMADQIGTLQQQALAFMDQDAQAELERLSAQHQTPLEREQAQAVIQDVKAQLRARVHHYARTSPFPQTGRDEEKIQWRDGILQKTKRDVLSAFDAYLRTRKGPNPEGG